MVNNQNQKNLEKNVGESNISNEAFVVEKNKLTEQVERQEKSVNEVKNLEKQEQRSEPISQPKTDDVSTNQVADIIDPEVKEIENILAEDLSDIYKNLPAAKQEEFKKKGEETAIQINLLLKNIKIKVKEILELIRDWLMIIPGVNKFFLEQEAKIKTDKLLSANKTKNSK